MLIYYGIKDNKIDITEICYTKLLNNDIITIPRGEFNRTKIFTDPIYGTLKKIFIINDSLLEFDHNIIIKINIKDNTIKYNTIKYNIDNDINNDINNKLSDIHNKLKINYGNFNQEIPEQKMVIQYLTGNEKVLEIGSNIGRNSLVIAYILNKNNNNNFVTLESDSNIAEQLYENRNLNNMNFYIENSALSKKKLIQKGWNTEVSDILLDGYKFINTLTLNDLNSKYNIIFDTLILDCEGAFYFILKDMPEILNNINLIIMENDFHDISQKNYVDSILEANDFFIDYVEAGGWGPCYNNFFEVWKKII